MKNEIELYYGQKVIENRYAFTDAEILKWRETYRNGGKIIEVAGKTKDVLTTRIAECSDSIGY